MSNHKHSIYTILLVMITMVSEVQFREQAINFKWTEHTVQGQLHEHNYIYIIGHHGQLPTSSVKNKVPETQRRNIPMSGQQQSFMHHPKVSLIYVFVFSSCSLETSWFWLVSISQAVNFHWLFNFPILLFVLKSTSICTEQLTQFVAPKKQQLPLRTGQF